MTPLIFLIIAAASLAYSKDELSGFELAIVLVIGLYLDLIAGAVNKLEEEYYERKRERRKREDAGRD